MSSSYFEQGNVYVLEVITKQAVNNCVNFCKAKTACKYINYYRPANVCFLVGVIGNIQIAKENFLESAPGFYFGAKEDWDMVCYF